MIMDVEPLYHILLILFDPLLLFPADHGQKCASFLSYPHESAIGHIRRPAAYHRGAAFLALYGTTGSHQLTTYADLHSNSM